MNNKKATTIGLIAILLWSTNVGLIRSIAGALGPLGGAAMLYTFSSVILLISVGFPKVSKFPMKYLFIGGAMFVLYELCLSLSIGLASSSSQAIEVSMVNYLWPSFTLLLTIILSGKKINLIMIFGVLVCLFGVGEVIGGEHGFSLPNMTDNIVSNPISYGLAFIGALIWSLYCVFTQRKANGCNGITLFFICTAVVLWLSFIKEETPPLHFTTRVFIELFLVSFAMGIGYAAWNVGILHGNVSVLATASYFIPVFSSVFATKLLGQSLDFYFWQGAIMVSFGSIICWWSSCRVK